jgi:hypothetical protein
MKWDKIFLAWLLYDFFLFDFSFIILFVFLRDFGWNCSPLPITNDTFVRLHSPPPAAVARFAFLFVWLDVFLHPLYIIFIKCLLIFNIGIFSMEDEDLASAARQTLEAVQRRVEMELMAAPILVSAAMADSSHLSIKGIAI